MTERRNRFDRLLKRLALAEPARDLYVGGAGEGGIGGEARLFGGLVAAQATMAAQNTVEGFPLHSLHAYFLRPGRAEQDIEYRVTRSKNGRNFQVREVDAWQAGECIFQLQASFHKQASGVMHADPMPDAPDPEGLPNRDQLRGRSYWQDMPLDVRMATPITESIPLPPEQRIWIRANGTLPPDPALHVAMLVYASDRCLLDTAWRPHADAGDLAGASLDHAMWFHQVPAFDDWLLYSMVSPVADSGRGLAFGSIYSRSGERLVTVAQEGLLRVM